MLIKEQALIPEIFGLITKVPNVVWSGVIASFLTFLGVLWTNKGHEKRQVTLLDHETEKYKADQKLSLKKEVFLEVANSFGNVLTIIPKLSDLEFSQKDIEQRLSGHAGIVAKSYLVAEESSVEEIIRFSGDMAEVLLELIPVRNSLLSHKLASEIYQKTIDTAREEKRQISLIMRDFNLKGEVDPATAEYLRGHYRLQDEIIDTNSKSKAKQLKILGPESLRFSKKCIAEQSKLSALVAPMTIALRNELENNGDSQVFTNALNQSISRMDIAFKKLYEFTGPKEESNEEGAS